MAQPFDPASLQTKGDPFPIADQVGTEGSRYATFAISPSGVLVYGRGNIGRGLQLMWFDRSGKSLSTVGDVANGLQSVALSPDELRAAVTLTTGTPPNRDVWIIDLARTVSSRLTFDATDDTFPVWSPDGGKIAFFSLRQGDPGIRVAPATGGATDELVLKINRPVNVAVPTDWSRDRHFIAYTQGSANTDVWILPLAGDRKPFPLASSSFAEDGATFSPDGRWIAYSSNESGQYQVYVQPFPPSGGKIQISRNGGGQPMWRGDGRELFFIAPDSAMMAATIDASRQFQAGVPQALFASHAAGAVQGRRQYAVTKDGKRFLVLALQPAAGSAPLTVVVNWLAAVQR
jgi:Tol biopolymer transport system component